MMEAVLGVVSLIFFGFIMGFGVCAIWSGKRVAQLNKEVQDLEERFAQLMQLLDSYAGGIDSEDRPGISVRFNKVV
ncbi:MAG TPA: hypothetical protein VN626_03975 [Clostridia bacterium]|nr:hypothetical protein [Clostridia bacterium]